MRPQEPPLVPAQRVLPHRGVAGYTGVVRIIGATAAPAAPKPAAKAPAKAPAPDAPVQPAPAEAVPAPAQPVEPAPADPDADQQDAPGPAPAAAAGDLDAMPRAELVRLAVSLGLKGSGTAAELAAAIRARPGEGA